ncbi:hypothetical protein [Streptomyces sp. NPDC053431]|uniref:hypothetical protein n=1 Tax=Streptomyces sp. NPDC053431 TaxID=3365703 RepID=UPI0037CFAC92
MSTEPQRPTSRITEALLPPERPTPPPPAAAPAPAPQPAAAPAPRPERPASAPQAERPAPAPRNERSASAPPAERHAPAPQAERPTPAPRTERPASRITEALLPPERPAAPAAPPAAGRPVAQPLPPEQPAPGAEAPTETTTRLRPVRDDRPAPSPGAGPVGTDRPAPAAGPARAYQPTPGGPPTRGAQSGREHRPAPAPRFAPPGGTIASGGTTPPGAATLPGGHGYAYDAWALGAETPVETTTRLRPVRERHTGRVVGAAACAVLALGLVGGALTGAVLAGSGAGQPAEAAGYTPARALWHNAPVDTLFPRTLAGAAAGPGGSARTWTRIVVAPDAPCTAATLPKELGTALGTVGCERVLRATYTDATSSHVVTVALVFTGADAPTMRTLGSRAADEVPPALAGPGTVAARFGAAQRASWWRHILPDLPVVVTSVSGFADGRAVAEPEPADRAMTPKRTTAVAQAGLGHEAKGVADAVERALRRTVAATVEEDQR